MRLPDGIRLRDGRYYWEVDKLRDDGSRYRKAGSSAKLPDAVNNRKAAIAAYEQNTIKGDKLTLAEWSAYCLESIMPVAPSRRGKPFAATTYEGYAQAVNKYIKPLLGALLLDKVTPEHIDKALASIDNAPSKIKVKAVGSKLFDLAIQRRKVATNPFKSVSVAKARKARHTNGATIEAHRVLTLTEEELLLSTAELHPTYSWAYGAILLGLRLGLRPGEILGLEWRNVDLDRGVITINQQRQRATKATRKALNIKSPTGLMVVDPKTDSGIRKIPLPASVATWLFAERERNATAYVLPNIYGTRPREPRRYSMALAQLVTLAGLDKSQDSHGTPLPTPTPHDLRHTFCSRLANDYKVPPQVLSAIAGHSDIKTTLAYYVHASDSSMAEAMAHLP